MTSTRPPGAAIPKVPTGYAELDQALGGAFNGKTVEIQTDWSGSAASNFKAGLTDFVAATGIKLNIEPSGTSYETLLTTRMYSGAPPDLAILDQPSEVLRYGQAGKLLDVATILDASRLNSEHAASIGLVTKGVHIWGIPYKLDLKSVVWYPIKAFAANGYRVPTTWRDLIELSDQIVKDGGNPWCIGMEAGTATGSQATDWVEELVLKTRGVAYYDRWIDHAILFEDEGIKNVLTNYVAKIFFTPDYVYGGTTAIVNTPQTQPMDPMFNQFMAAPGCWMQKQATWYGPDLFPDERSTGNQSQYKIGQDVGIFAFPPIESTATAPAEGSLDTVVVVADRAEVRAAAEFLATPEGTENWVRAGSAISANQSAPADGYAGSYKSKVAADLIDDVSALRTDGSDGMPPAVGAGTFPSQMIEWINNNGRNTDTVLNAIDDSWPSH